jgi:lysozyme
MNSMRTSAAGRKAIAAHEGNVLTAYQDSVGVWTIGVGHTAAAGAPIPKKGMKITAAESDEILSRDLAGVEAEVNKLVKVPLNQSQFDALVSLVFNIGGTAFRKSTLLRKLNAGDYAGAAAQFASWDKGTIGGKKVAIKGLTNRRADERKLFLSEPAKATPAPTSATPATTGPSSEVITSVQQLLRDRGYPEVGNVDGKMGQRTRNAILSFQSDNGYALTGEITDGLLANLVKAQQRKVSEERSTATAKDLKDAPSVQQGDLLKRVGMGVLVSSGIGGLLDGTGDIERAITGIGKLRALTDTLLSLSPWLLGVGAGGAAIYFGSRFIREQVKAFREGRHV